jgi:hypothetical protein
MAIEHFLHDRPYNGLQHNHVGEHSHRMRLQEAEHLIWEWRMDQVESQNKRLGFVEGDQFTPYDLERIEEIRAELRECEL